MRNFVAAVFDVFDAFDVGFEIAVSVAASSGRARSTLLEFFP